MTLYLTLFEYTNNDIVDATPNDNIDGINPGHLLNGAECVDGGKFDKAIKFDGVDDMVYVSADSSFDLGGGDFTLEVWVKLGSISNAQQGMSNVQMPVIHREGSYTLSLVKGEVTSLQLSVKSGEEEYILRGAADLKDDWNQIAAVRYTNRLGLLLNGYEIAAMPFDKTINPSVYPLRIGKGFKGKIDEVSITKACVYPLEVSPDSSTSLNHAHLRNGAAISEEAGKFGKSLTLNGSEAYAIVPKMEIGNSLLEIELSGYRRDSCFR